MADHYKHLEKAMCKELERLDRKYASDTDDMTLADVEQADKLYHSLKSAATYYAMKDAEDDDENEMETEHSGRSYARGGYSRGRYPITGGYAMAPGYDDRRSGYYPMEYYDPYRRY